MTYYVYKWNHSKIAWKTLLQSSFQSPSDCYVIWREGTDKSLARPTSRRRRTNRLCRWKEGSVHVPNCKSFLVTETEGKRIRRRAWFQQHGDASCHQGFFPARQGAEGNSRHSERNIRGTCTIVCHRHNWVALFKRGDFSTCDAPRPGRLKTVITPAIIDQIHDLILEDRRISGKSIAEQLGISCQRIGSIIHEDLDMRKPSAKWVPTCLNADQKHQRCQSSEQIMEFYRLDPNDVLSRWWPRTKPNYITMTRRQSNSQ